MTVKLTIKTLFSHLVTLELERIYSILPSILHRRHVLVSSPIHPLYTPSTPPPDTRLDEQDVRSNRSRSASQSWHARPPPPSLGTTVQGSL
eukprot:1923338-Pyramimonas_sp.AAC.1